MNRFAAHGLIREASEGADILVLTHSQQEARRALDETARLADPARVQVRRANGAESITFDTGGRLRFQPPGANVRGMNVTAVFIDEGARDDISLTQLHNLQIASQGAVICA